MWSYVQLSALYILTLKLKRIMKIVTALLSFFSLLTIGTNAQTKKPTTHHCSSEADCCNQNKTKGTLQNPKTVFPMTTPAKIKQVTCKLTSPELRKRKEEVIAVLKCKVLEKEELKDGYRYTFEGSDTMMDALVEFIKTERQCCNFISFNLTVNDEESNLWLSLTGPEGAKDFIKTELDF
jgi:hypothetical protein